MKQFTSIVVLILLMGLTASQMLAQAPPRELEATYSPLDRAIELRWHEPNSTTPPEHYNVYRKTGMGGDFAVIATPADRRYDDSDLTPGTPYTYKVTAVYAGNIESLPTNMAFASMPDSTVGPVLPPRDLSGYFDDRGKVELHWFPPDSGSNPSFYKVFRSDSPTGGFLPIGNAPETEFHDLFVFPNHTYAYRVTAMYNGLGESDPSNTVEILTIPDSSEDSGFHMPVHFTSEPVRVAFVGQPYSYDADAVSDPAGSEICYSLRHAPPGMTIDAATGVISWIPAIMGVVEVEVKARICAGSEGEAEQEYHIVVLSGNPGTISGDVRNGASEPLAGVKMKLFNVSQGFFVLRSFTDSTGHYSFPYVNPGTYLLRADAERHVYEDEWYDNASSRETATPIVITEGSSFTADFVLSADDTFSIPTFTLSGTVLDTLNAPIVGAAVTVFSRCSDDSSDDDHFDDSHRRHGMDRSVLTDANGSYSFTLRQGNYIVGAKKHGYLPQFYNHKPQPFEADRITLNQNVTGIDFNLAQRAVGTGSISGVVRSAADSTGLPSFVLGFRKHDDHHEFHGFVASTYADSTGAYTLENLNDGNYIVLAVPAGQFTPTFYNTTGGTPFRRDATPVAVAGSAITGIDMYAQADSDDGLNTVAGHVSSGDGGQGITTSAVAPLAGVLVTITDPATNMPLSSSITETDGAYYATGLAPGVYNVIFQKPEYTDLSLQVVVNYSNNTPVISNADALMLVEGGPGLPGLMSVRQSWNLISLPVDVANAATSVLFPGAVSDAFSFASSVGFQPQSNLTPGAGYWLKFPGASAFVLDGTVRTSQTVNLNEGWNLVGSLTDPVNAAAITTSPIGIIASPFWEYSGAYSRTSTLVAGKGYWVKATSAGTATMSSSATAAKGSPMYAEALAKLNSVTVTDATGNSQTLYFGRPAQGFVPAQFDMPPAPPAGAFDVRFASSRFAEEFQQSAPEQSVVIRDAVAPVTLAWNLIDGGQYSVRTTGGSTVARMQSTAGSVILPAVSSIVLRSETSGIPSAYGLDQNYPNPFNPTTNIRFQLPAESRVTLKVYNLIGQEVATLVNGEMLGAGEQSAMLDASNLTSGVYFYKLSAVNGSGDSFVSVKKMMLMK